MRVLFVTSLTGAITPRHPLRSPEQIQFGISYLSAVLRQHGHETRLVVLSHAWGRRNLHLVNQVARDFLPQLVLLTAVTSEFPFISTMASRLRKRFPGAYLVLGGPHASLRPDEAIQADVDAVCVGEGEEAVVQLATQIETLNGPHAVAGLWMKVSGRIVRYPPGLRVEDLDTLPYPDRDIWTPWIDPTSHGRPAVLLGRGCPFLCTYCCNHALRRTAPGTYVRLRRPDAIVEEIENLVSRSTRVADPPREIALEVESIDLDRRWALELCHRLERFNAGQETPVGFATNFRVRRRIDPEPLFRAMARAGFRGVTIGLEAGSDRIRREVLRRACTTQDVLDGVRCARRHGLRVVLQNMIGVPGETEEDAIETALLNRVLRPDRYYVSIFHPYPGTELHATCLERGLEVRPLRGGRERSVPVIDPPEFPARRIRRTYVWFDRHVQEGVAPWRQIAPRVFKAWVRTHPRLDEAAQRIRAMLSWREVRLGPRRGHVPARAHRPARLSRPGGA